MKISFILLLIVSICSKCSPIMGIYGVKKPKVINEKKILRYAKKIDIPSVDIFELDTAYFSYLFSLDTTSLKEQIKNHYQPLQALYFDKSGQLESFQINCYAGGFPNIDWCRDSTFSIFPPKLQAPIDTLISITTQMNYLNPLTQTIELKPEDHDYIVFVYWSKFMGRQSKRFIKFIQENSALAADSNQRIIYINTDNSFALKDIW